MTDDSLKYVNECYEVLKDMDIIDSKYQFSKQFLGKCANYYGVMLCENRKAPNDMLYHLNQKMAQLTECFNDSRLKPLLDKGVDILNKRFEQYFRFKDCIKKI